MRIISVMAIVGTAWSLPAAAWTPDTPAPAQSQATAGSPAQEIARIKAYREAGEKKLRDNTLTRKTVPLSGAKVKESIRQKWEKMEAYYDQGKLVRIQLYPHKGSQRTEEFYLIDDKLVFAFIQDKGPKREGRDMGEPGKEFYFRDDKLLLYEDRSGDEESDVEQEKKMYETRLPYEISELLEILASK